MHEALDYAETANMLSAGPAAARLENIRTWRGLSWPVNEVLLRSLVMTGKSNEQIAALCGVEDRDVTELREQFDL